MWSFLQPSQIVANVHVSVPAVNTLFSEANYMIIHAKRFIVWAICILKHWKWNALIRSHCIHDIFMNQQSTPGFEDLAKT